jgi:hypothetical protein
VEEDEHMAEQDPRDYRGGAHEPEGAKPGGTGNEGVVPREMVDDPGAPPAERDQDQALSDSSLGEVTDRSDPSQDNIDHSGGDDADATSHSGTGGNVEEVKEQMQEGEPAPWVQGANVAAGDTSEDADATA